MVCSDFTFENATSNCKLDFKQRVAFEIMACSYILKILEIEHVIDKSTCSFFASNKMER